MKKAKKEKLPVRKDGGCHPGPFVGMIICKPTTTGILERKHRKLIGNGLVTVPAHMARCILSYIKELPKDCMIVYQDEIHETVKSQLCSWCDGMGWQAVNCMEDTVACPHCAGNGLEPEKSRPKLPKLTDKMWERMQLVLKYIPNGEDVGVVARKLKVTRERVRQLYKMASERAKWRTAERDTRLEAAGTLMKEMLIHIDGMPGTHVGPPPHVFTGPQRELAHRVVLFLRSIGVDVLGKCCGEPTL